MKKSLLWIVILIVLVGLVIAFTGDNSEDGEQATGPIKIGFIGPLTGDAAAFGEAISNAIDIAVSEVNEEGGVNGRLIEIIYEDGACTGVNATNAAQKLINIDQVNVIIGGVCSGETLAVAPLAEQNEVILFSPGSGSPDITNAGDYIFRNFPSDATSGSKVAEEAVARGYTTAGILSESNDYSQALKRVFVETYTSNGGEVLVDESFRTKDTDLRTQLSKIKAANPDAIYFVTSAPPKAELAFRQIGELGLPQQILSNEFLSTENVLNNYAEVVEGGLYAEPSFNPDSSASAEFLDKYISTYGELGDTLPPFYLATAYDAVHVLADVMEKVGTNTNDIKEELYNVNRREGAAGVLTLDENGDPEFEYTLKTIRDGQAVTQ